MIVPKEPPQDLALRRRDPEAARIRLELLDEREEGRVLVQLALVKVPAPVDDDLLLEDALLPVRKSDRAVHDPGLAAELLVGEVAL